MEYKREEGYVNVNGLNLYYIRFLPEKIKGKVIGLHGGPGMSLDYMLPLEDLAKYGYEVLLYDQFGCGRSEEPKNLSDFNMDYARDEVEGVRNKFYGDEKVFLIGSSYGGALTLYYALKYQNNLRGMVVSGGLASVPYTVEEMNRLISEMPPEISKIIRKYNEIGDYENEDYKKAVWEFYRRHLIRMDNIPPEVMKSLEFAEKRKVYSIMNGPNEFTITGTIKDWDITDKLNEIKVPTLITVGEFDEVTPNVAKQINQGIKNSKMVIFKGCSHLTMWENRASYIETIKEFLDSLS